MEKRVIKFDVDAHRYSDEYGKVYTSVTQLIGKVEPKYDEEYWSIYRTLDQRGFNPRPFVETRMIEILFHGKRRKFLIPDLIKNLPVNEWRSVVVNDWEAIKVEACRWGTTKHEFLEDNLNKILNTTSVTVDMIKRNTEEFGYAFKVTNRKELEESPLKFAYPSIYREICKYIEDGWTLFSEKRVYSASYQIAGTIDLLLVKNGECFIIDWKTNREPLKFAPGYYKKVWNADKTKKIKTNEWVDTKDTLLYPLKSVSYCKGSIYTLQLSSYHYLCYMWGLRPIGTLLVHIRPKLDSQGEILLDTNGDRIEEEPEFYKLPIWRKETQILFQWHKAQVNP